MSEKHHPTKIYYTLKKFNNFKNNYNKVKNKNIQTQNYLDNIEVKGRKLLISTHKYLDNDNIQHNIKIFGTKNSKLNLSNKYFTQFFVDSIYKYIPNNIGYKALLLIIGYNSKNYNFELCSVIFTYP